MGLRAAVLSAGARLLERMLDGLGCGRRDEPLYCGCGGRMRSVGRKEKRVRTVLGEIKFRRSVFVCEWCGASRVPGDEALRVVSTGFSPGLRRLMSRAGSRSTFKEGRDDLKEYGAIEVTSKEVERVAEGVGEMTGEWERKAREEMVSKFAYDLQPVPKDIPLLYVSYDGTGVPMVPWEVAGRKGKQPDGSSKTREVKLGCVFTQSKLDEEGRPVRDESSTSFVGAIENSLDFGWRIYGEALRRGVERAEKVVVIGDGARWVWNLADTHFGRATQIVDLYHARQHLYELCSLLSKGDEKIKTDCKTRWLTALDEGDVEKIIREASALLPKRGERRKLALKELGYLRNNAHRMRYAEFREQGLFIGSGVVEAGCKTIVGMRLKRSGMEWTVRGANSIIALRCAHLSGRIQDFWEDQAA